MKQFKKVPNFEPTKVALLVASIATITLVVLATISVISSAKL